MIRRLASFARHQGGASAAEFALVLPAALLFLLGIIDVGRYAWTINQYEKATQMGARFAAVTDVVSTGLVDQTYIGDTSCNGGVALVAGQTICRDALDKLTCTANSCSCTGSCPDDSTTADADAFTAIVTRMKLIAPRIAASNVSVDYSGSGIGFAGDPSKPEIAPIITVRLTGLNYSPITLSPIGGTVPLPNFRYSLTLEDGEGSQSS